MPKKYRERVPLADRLKALEEAHGRPARDIVVDAIRSEGSVLGAAKKLGMPLWTMYHAVDRLHITTKTATRVVA